METKKIKLGTTSFEEYAKENGVNFEKVKEIKKRDLDISPLGNNEIFLYKYISKKSGKNVMVIEESFSNEDLFYIIILVEIEENLLTTSLIKELIEEV